MTAESQPQRGTGLRVHWSSTLAAVLAVAFVGLALAYSIRQDAPLGSLRGTVFVAETQRPLAAVRITLDPVRSADDGELSDAPKIRHAHTGPDGTFSLAHVPAGDYTVTAVSRAHSASHIPITVTEGGATQAFLSLTRSESALAIKVHQRVFGTDESPHLSVTGYADETRPAGSDGIQVRIWKTRLSEVLKSGEGSSALQKVGSSYDHVAALPSTLLHPAGSSAPRPYATRTVRIKEDPEGFFYQTLDFATMHLGHAPAGLYLMELRHRDSAACAWMLVTNTALVAKRSNDRVLGFAVDMKTGAPAAGSRLEAYRSGRVVGKAECGPNGVGELTLTGVARGGDSDSEAKRVTLVAVRGDDEAVVDRSYYRDEGAELYAVHTYTDRPIYRPGQHVSFKSIVRKTDPAPADTQTRFSAPVGREVVVELRDPTGEQIYQQTLHTNRYGSVADGVDINAEAPTGVYTLKTTVDGSEHTHDVVIASYRKPEFAVTVTPEKKRYGQGDQVRMTVAAQYYFGAPVSGAKVRYEVYSSPDWTTEYGLPDDTGEPADDVPEPGVGRSHEYLGGEVTRGEARLDENGKAVVIFPTTNPERPRFMREAETYTLSATVIEGENRQAQADGAALITPGAFAIAAVPQGYVGAPGKATTVSLSARDYDRKVVPNVPVELQMGYQQWANGALVFRETGRRTVTLGQDGRLSLDVVPPRQGDFVIKALARDPQGHQIVGRASLYVSDDAGGDLDTEYADLAILTDKKSYHAGDMARVLINSQRSGQTVLLTVEGERLYGQQTVLMERKSRIVYVPIRREFGPNAFLAACYVRDKHIAQSSAALRVATPQRELKVEVTPDRPASAAGPARYSPGDRVTYRVRATDAAGHPARCELSLGVVDESIYALKEDDPAALRDSFYPRRSNYVSTDYSFAIQYLGDADKSEPKITARKKFPDTAYWNPFVVTDAAGVATVSFPLPDNLTTWRTTVTAHSLDTRLGRATCKVLSAKDFLVRLQSPRFLTQKDQAEIVAFIHNDTGAPQTALVHLMAENLGVGGQAVQTLQLAAGQIGRAAWPVDAVNYGTARLTVKAWTPKQTASPQYTDGLETSLPIRPHGREDVQAFAGQITATTPQSEVVRLDPAAVPGLSRLSVHITPSIASALFGATEYLIGFPYGCTEQTMSRFMPDLLLQRAMRSNAIAEVPASKDLPKMVRDSLQRLYRFQHGDSGAWGWWEHDPDNAWMTAYVISGLAVARDAGYPVRAAVLAKADKAAAKMAGDVKTDLSDRAYLIYALARSGDLAAAAKERARQIPLSKFRPDALAYMVMTDGLLGKPDPAVLTEMMRRSVSRDGLLYWKTGETIFDWDDIGTTTVALRALIATDPHDSRIGPGISWLMMRRSGRYWSSTRDTSLTLMAFCDYMFGSGGTSGTGEIRIKLNGALYKTYKMTPELAREREVVCRIAPTAIRPDKNDITLERVGGDSRIFYSVEMKQTIATEDLPAVPNPKLEIKREYLRIVPRAAGSGTVTDQAEPTNNQLSGSDWVRVRLTIKASRDMHYVLIEDPFAAGCEVNERGDVGDTVDWNYWWSSVDLRDDRIAFFCRTLAKGEHTIEYNLRAQTPGVYHVLPATAEAMYSPDAHAESAESRVTVK